MGVETNFECRELWGKILNTFKCKETELHTNPLTSATPRWFTVYSEAGCMYVFSAKINKPASKISHPRRLCYSEFEKMYPIYLKRKAGYAVSAEATSTSRNQVYWYAILKYCSL